jgi:phage terminase Nu1 subunit (DNA packaging protein)
VRRADRALATANIDEGEVTTFAEAQRRWRLATAMLRELELKQKSGGLVYAEDMQREIERVFGNVRSRLLNIPVKMAPVLVGIHSPGEVEKLLRSEIYSALEFLAEHCVDQDFQLPPDAFGTNPQRLV